MDGHELVECLEKSGTGREKLRHARNFLHERPSGTAEEVYQALEKSGERSDGGPNRHTGTLTKARKLMTGNREAVMAEFMGKAPERHQDESLARAVGAEFKRVFVAMAEESAQKQAEAQALGVGRPQKPSRGQ